MHFRSLAVAISFAASALATTWTIQVGQNGTKTFTPPSVNASVGDTINFVFVAGNHSVYQSSFAEPCTLKGFKNDFQPVKAAGVAPFPMIQMAVNTTDPIWFYCPQTINISHCHAGMVGAINPTADLTFDAFRSAALANTTATSSASNTTTTTPASTSSNTTTPAGNSSSNNHTNGAVAQLRMSTLVTGSSAALLGVVASAMLAL